MSAHADFIDSEAVILAGLVCVRRADVILRNSFVILARVARAALIRITEGVQSGGRLLCQDQK